MLANASNREATNDLAESPFALFKYNLHCAPSLGFGAAGGMTMGKMNRRWCVATSPQKNKSKHSAKRQRNAKAAGQGLCLRGVLLSAVVATTKSSVADERSKTRKLLQAQDTHTAARRAAKLKEKRDKDAERVANAVCARVVVRVRTLAKLKRLIKGKTGEKRRQILAAQVKQRTIGSGLGEKHYGFKISLFSKEKGIAKTCEALYNQLVKMIKLENTAANRAALQTPEELPFRSSFNPPQLGAATTERKAHELSAAARWAALEEKEDNLELVELDAKYKGQLFTDTVANEHRIIVDVEWNDTYDRYQALTDKVYAPGTHHAGKRMKRYERVAYGLAEQEQAEMDRMMTRHQELCAEAEKKQRKRKQRSAGSKKSRAAPRRAKKSRKGSRRRG